MVSGPETAYRVEVRHNLVVAISAVPRGSAHIYADPLEVSTALSQNNLENGCFDGAYHLADFETARHFAALCAGYMKALSERTVASISAAGGDGRLDWINPNLPSAAAPQTPPQGG